MQKLGSTLTVLCLGFSIHLLAQDQTKFFYDKDWQLTWPDSSVYYRLLSFDSLHLQFDGSVEDFTIDGKSVMKGTYTKGLKEGVFISYYPNGQIESIGAYLKNTSIGKWKYYYENGTLKQEIDFEEPEPKIVSYYDSAGNPLLENGNGKWKEEYYEFQYPHKIIITGQYADGNKNGEWICRLSNGEFVYKEQFVRGIYQSGYLTDEKGNVKQVNREEFKNKLRPPFKFEITEKLKTAKGISHLQYAFMPDENDRLYTVVEHQPEFPGGYEALLKFLQKNVIYPPEARRLGITGRVFINFVINKDGSISDVTVVHGVREDLNSEAVRVVKSFPNWIPGQQNGRIVRVKYVLPINFKLGR